MPLSLRYVAGFFDGEGCVGFAKSRGNIFPRVLVTNTNIEILEDFRDQFGGDVYVSKVGGKESWKPRGIWRLSWTKAVDFLDKIQPYLRLKTMQACTVFAWDTIRPARGNRSTQEYKKTCEYLVDYMHKLNKRGV